MKRRMAMLAGRRTRSLRCCQHRRARGLARGPGRADACLIQSILRHAGIDLVTPGQDAALHVAYLLEAGVAENPAGFGAAHAAFAVNDDIGVLVELVQMLANLTQRNQLGPWNFRDLVFVRLADIQEYEIV